MLEIKSDAELNQFASDIENKITAIETEAVKKGDIELVQKENVELKAALEVNKKALSDVQEIVKNKFSVKSPEEKLSTYGKFLYAARTNNLEMVHSLGGFVNSAPDSDNWKDDGWVMNAAPDVGTPLRGDATTGSYLVPASFAAEILRLPDDPSALMNRVRTVPMSVRKITYPAKANGVSFSWPTNEVTAKTEKNPTFSYIDLEAKTAAGWVPFTEELNEDSLVPLGAYFTDLFREAWQKEFDTQLLNSNAAPFTGVLHNATVNKYNMGAGSVSFTDATLDDLQSLAGKLTTQAKRNGAYYMMHLTVLDHFKTLKDDNGNYIWSQPAGTTPGTLWGYPVIVSDAMPDASSSAKSTAFVAFGNPKNLLHGDRIGMEIKIFEQTMDTLIYDRLFLRCRLRQAFNVAIPDAFAVMKTASA